MERMQRLLHAADMQQVCEHGKLKPLGTSRLAGLRERLGRTWNTELMR